MSQREDIADEDTYLRTAFLERLAHELRGPAGVIQGALQELTVALGEDAAKHEALIAIALRGVKRIARNADRLQQTALLERGRIQLSCAQCDLPALLRRAVQEARVVENRRNIEVEVNAPTHPLMGTLDSHWMGVAFYELTSNAIRHARKRAEIRLADDPSWVTVRFVDDNPNSAQFAPNRFRSNAGAARGLGLALAIVRDVVDAHGGQLEISNESHGKEVMLRIPRVVSTLVGQAATS